MHAHVRRNSYSFITYLLSDSHVPGIVHGGPYIHISLIFKTIKKYTRIHTHTYFLVMKNIQILFYICDMYILVYQSTIKT